MDIIKLHQATIRLKAKLPSRLPTISFPYIFDHSNSLPTMMVDYHGEVTTTSGEYIGFWEMWTETTLNETYHGKGTKYVPLVGNTKLIQEDNEKVLIKIIPMEEEDYAGYSKLNDQTIKFKEKGAKNESRKDKGSV